MHPASIIVLTKSNLAEPGEKGKGFKLKTVILILDPKKNFYKGQTLEPIRKVMEILIFTIVGNRHCLFQRGI